MSNRRKKFLNNVSDNDMSIRFVELTRTKNGYGFTLSGEMPCMLTQVKGYANTCGLRSGDYLISVNGQDVSQMSHDHIVRLITCSGSTLKLKIVENSDYFSSNSDESEYDRNDTSKQRPRYPYRHRKSSFSNNANSFNSNQHYFHNHNNGTNDLKSKRRQVNGYPKIRSNEGLLDLLLQQRLSKINNNSSDSDSHFNGDNKHVNDNQTQFRDQKSRLNRRNANTCSLNVMNASQTIIFNDKDINTDILHPSLERARNNNESPYEQMNNSDISEDLHSRALLRAIVGYLGTIEMHKESNIDSLVIKNCIRRIRVENKVHTTILLAVYSEGIILANIEGQLIAEFAAQSITSCGICADDNKYFGLITTNGNENTRQIKCQPQKELSYSCHVFLTTPSAHQIHYRTASNFGIKCTLDPITSSCLEFPESSDPILRVMVGLYRNKLGCAPPALANVNVIHSSSNSDSGINENCPSFIQNDSYNSLQLEAQLNPTNMRQTVHKYFKLKQDSNQKEYLSTNLTQQSSNRIYNQMNAHHSHLNQDNTVIDFNDSFVNHTKHVKQDDNRTEIYCTGKGIKMYNHEDTQIETQDSNVPNIEAEDKSDDTQSSVSDEKTIHMTANTKSWRKPATLCKENLELNNEITLGFDCDTKSSMSLEGMPPMSDSISASASVVSERPIDVGWVGGWAQDFEKLLSDNVGLNAFAEFLKKEFSYENLQFWISCEQFKKLTNEEEMKREAKNIFDRHLCIGAPEAVNVDSHARLIAEKGLNEPTQLLFFAAEKQIFNLMKFDCYQRFLKSDIYKECVSLELQGKALPYERRMNGESESPFNEKLKTIKPKRRSFIPWHKMKSHKAQHKNAVQKQVNTQQPIIRKLSHSLNKIRSNPNTLEDGMSTCSANRSDFTGSQSSIASSEPIDKSGTAFALSKSKESINESNTYHMFGHCKRDNCRLSRVILPDRSQTVVPLTQGLQIGEMIFKLIEKRHLQYSAYDAFVTGCDKPLNLNLDVSTLGCNEIRVEQRILFQLDFPNKEIIGVKARPSKLCGDVLRPLLNKYGYKLEHIVLQIANSSKCVTNDMPITLIDNQRIIVSIKDDLEEWGWDCNISRIPVAVDKDKTRSPTAAHFGQRLADDSFINQVATEPFNDINDAINSSDDSPGKENHLPLMTPLVENLKLSNSNDDCERTLMATNISFSDDSKSEAFFKDVMQFSQQMPTNENSFSLSPKPIAQKRNSLKVMANTNLNTVNAINTVAMKASQRNTGVGSQLAKYNSEIKFSKCNLSPIERVMDNSNLNVTNCINDIDLDQTLKSMQNMNNPLITDFEDQLPQLDANLLTPSQIGEDMSLKDINVANYTPPTPINKTMSLLANQHKSPIRRLSSDPPPLPPKICQRGRGPPPRPPTGKHYPIVNDLVGAHHHSDNSLMRNIDQITYNSNISFV